MNNTEPTKNFLIKSPVERLTNRERDVFNLFLDGKNQTQVAVTLCIKKDTVKSHRKSIYKKLGVSSRNELIKKYKN